MLESYRYPGLTMTKLSKQERGVKEFEVMSEEDRNKADEIWARIATNVERRRLQKVELSRIELMESEITRILYEIETRRLWYGAVRY
jgi:hypothetical protein